MKDGLQPVKKTTNKGLRFPRNILGAVSNLLTSESKRLEKKKKKLSLEDPFADVRRLNDNASPDTDAAEQFGHATVIAMQKQVDRKLVQIRKALASIIIGKYGICERCGKKIDTDRLMVMPETTICVVCEKDKEK